LQVQVLLVQGVVGYKQTQGFRFLLSGSSFLLARLGMESNPTNITRRVGH